MTNPATVSSSSDSDSDSSFLGSKGSGIGGVLTGVWIGVTTREACPDLVLDVKMFWRSAPLAAPFFMSDGSLKGFYLFGIRTAF